MLVLNPASNETSSLETLGTVAEFVGVGGSYEPVGANNFKGTMKETGKLTAVTIRMVDATGASQIINCSAPLSADLRASKSPEILQEKLNNIASLPILKIPQVNRSTGEPIMDVDKTTGEETQRILYVIGNSSGSDMSNVRVNVTKDNVAKTAETRTITFEDLIAL